MRDYMVAEQLQGFYGVFHRQLHGHAEGDLIAAYVGIGLCLSKHLVGIAAEEESGVYLLIDRGEIDVGQHIRPGRHALGLGEGVVVFEHQRLQIADAVEVCCHFTGFLAVFQADHAVGDHYIVVHIVAHGLCVYDRLFVGLDMFFHLEDGAHIEAEHAHSVVGRLFVCGGVACGDPHGRVRVHIGLGKDIEASPCALFWGLEGLAFVGVFGLPPHLSELPDHLFPVGLGVFFLDAEAAYLVAARASAGAELKAAFGDMIQHGDSLGELDGMIDYRVQVEDARAQVYLLGLGEGVAHENLAGRGVRIVLQEVVLGDPGILPVVLICHADELQIIHETLMLPVGAASTASAGMALNKD